MSVNYNKKSSTTTKSSLTTGGTIRNKDGTFLSKSSTTTKVTSSTAKAPNTLLLIFFIVAVILVVINLVRFSNGSADVTFAGFLNYIKDAPRLISFVSVQEFTIFGDWGLFDGLRSFLNIFASIFGVIVWLGASLINMLGYFSYFITYLFV